MKGLKIGLAFMAAAVFTLGFGGAAYAFHSGGVAECGGCHSMHEAKPGGSFMLVGIDQSSTCLSCHGKSGAGSYHIATPDADMGAGIAPYNRTPGGDFGWLKKTYTFSVRGTPNTEAGATHGHNIVAADYGYTVDPTNTTAPGGNGLFPSSQLGCQSCHDPHSGNRRLSDGNYQKGGAAIGQTAAPIISSGSYNTNALPVAGQAVGVYRLLRGLGDISQGVTFAGVAIAVAPSTYNQGEATNQVRVAYGASGTNTWSNWCASCHVDMATDSNAQHRHPVDESLSSDLANNYNAYVKSGDMSGSSATSFTSLVPFIENTGDIALLKSHASNAGAYLNGPGTSDQVACLSCHRAHATGFPEMLRWNMENEFMVKNGVYQVEERGRSNAEATASYYDRPVTQFASYQRVLCNKCHAKD